LDALFELSQSRAWLGEVVILIEGCLGRERWPEALLDEALEKVFFEGKKVSGLKDIAKQLAVRSLWSDREVYQRALRLKKLRETES
jgi:hypothetical protein